MRVGSQSGDTEIEKSDPLPDETEHCLVTCGEVTVTKAKRYAEYLPGELELDNQSGAFSSHPSVTFEAGDIVPVAVVRDCWKAFEAYTACFDGDGIRLDRPSEYEKKRGGTAKKAEQELRTKLGE
jgi:hypothetical protein